MPSEQTDILTSIVDPAATVAGRLLIACGLLVACSDRKVAPKPPDPTPVPVVVEEKATPPVTSPHTGRVHLVATTDRGDAVISLDGTGALRLWPILDGAHEPIVVHAAAPRELALARDGTGLVAAILDEAGGVELIRFDGNGGEFGRAKLPPEPAAVEIVLAAGNVVVRRSDESLARFDVRGVASGVLVAEPGQRIVSIAARRDRVIAGVGDSFATHVRFVTAAFAWEPPIALPVPLVDLALAPGHLRIAGYAEDKAAKVVELSPVVKLLGSVKPEIRPVFLRKSGGPSPQPEPPIVGFVDDDYVLTSGPDLRWTAGPKWTLLERTRTQPESHAAIGDVAITGHAAGLMLEGTASRQFLGYRKQGGDGVLHGAHVLAVGNREVFWLDDQLRATRVTKEIDLYDYKGPGPPPSVLFALDDSHLLLSQTVSYDAGAKQRVLIHDIKTKQSVEIGLLPTTHSYTAFDPVTKVFALRADPLVYRFRIDSPTTATRLRPLAGAADSLMPIFLTDPARANGVAAVVVPSDKDAKLFVESPGSGPIQPRALSKFAGGRLLGVDGAANIYLAAPDAVHVFHPDDTPTERLPIASAWYGAVSEDGQSLVFMVNNGSLVMFDRNGTERWRIGVEQVRDVVVRGRAVIVRTLSGIIAFDVRTGARLAAVCGWGFGLYDTPELAMAPNVPSTCADGR